MWDTNHSLLREEFYICRTDPMVGHHAGDGVFGKPASLLLLPISCGPFILDCGVAVQLVLGFFSEGAVLYIAVNFLCL